jgi:hypothetical protein
MIKPREVIAWCLVYMLLNLNANGQTQAPFGPSPPASSTEAAGTESFPITCQTVCVSNLPASREFWKVNLARYGLAVAQSASGVSTH